MRRGDVYWCRLDPVVGCEQAGVRPVVVVQNDVGNRFSPTVIVAVITGNIAVADAPFGAAIPEGTLPKASAVNCAHVRTVDRSRLTGQPFARLDRATMIEVDEALAISLGLPRPL